MIRIVRYIFIVFTIAVCTDSFAQRYLSTTRTIVIPKVEDVSVTAGSTAFSFAATSNYDAGIAKTSLFAVTVKANVPWKLSFSVPAALLSPQVTITPMPVGIFSLRNLSFDPNYHTITYPTPIYSTGSRGQYTFNIDINANPGYLYEQNTYLTDIYFVISDP